MLVNSRRFAANMLDHTIAVNIIRGLERNRMEKVIKQSDEPESSRNVPRPRNKYRPNDVKGSSSKMMVGLNNNNNSAQ
jgi:hypothetical protein